MVPAVKVVIVNYNAGEALLRCIASVIGSTEMPDIVIADNASSDGSDQIARARYGHLTNLEVLNNAQNLGFAKAVNGAVNGGQHDQPRYVLILNPDCELEPQALSRLKAALDEDPDAGLAGPCVLSPPRRGRERVEKSALRKFPDPWTSLMSLSGLARLAGRGHALQGIEQPPSAALVRAEAVSGACMLVRRVDFDAVGGLDEGYAMHCEDLDLMYRLRQAGRHCLYVPQARVRHLKGLSSRSRPWWVHHQKHLGMQRFYRKFQASRHLPPFRWLVYGGIWLHYLLTAPAILIRR